MLDLRTRAGPLSLLLICALPACAQFVERGVKVAGSGAPAPARQGSSVALSADGTTMIEGGPEDDGGRGAVWLFTRTAKGWAQQGEKLAAKDARGQRTFQGRSVALSADGNTALFGGDGDGDGVGAAWVLTRSNGVWSEQAKLTGSPAEGKSRQGVSVALSADGNTALIGGIGDDGGAGAAWVFTRLDDVWTEQGSKLVGSGASGAAMQGSAVALSANGGTAVVGGAGDSDGLGAAWIFTLSGGMWTEQGPKLIGIGAAGAAHFGSSAAISAGGDMAAIGGWGDNADAGAAWIFALAGGAWIGQGAKLPGASGAQLGYSAALAGDGNHLLLGAPGMAEGIGAVWEYRLSGSAWTLLNELAGRGAQGKARLGSAVAISTDGDAAVSGGTADAGAAGAVWSFGNPTLAISAPESATAGTAVSITVTAQDGAGNTAGGYRGTIHFTTSDGQADAPADAALVEGVGTFSLVFRTSGAQTIALADTAFPAVSASSVPIPVSPGPAARFVVTAPEWAVTGQDVPVTVVALDQFQNRADFQGSVILTSSDPRAELPAAVVLGGPQSGAATVRFATPGKQTLVATASSIAGGALISLAGRVTSRNYVATVLATHPKAYFRLEAAGDTSLVNGYQSTFRGDAAPTAGADVGDAANHAVALDGAGGWVSTTLSGAIGKAGSMIAWVKLAELPASAGHNLYVAGESGSPTGFELEFTPDNRLHFHAGDPSKSVIYQPDASRLVGQWHMIAATFDAGADSSDLYWDGQLVATGNRVFSADQAAPFQIGEGADSRGRVFSGGIDEVAVWDRALTAAEVRAIHASSTGGSLSEDDSESISVSDIASLMLSMMIPDGESVSVSDSVNLNLSAMLPDRETVTVSDTVILVPSLTLPINETVRVMDSASLSPCDLNGNAPNVADAQTLLNEALGLLPPVNDLNGDGIVNVVDLQIEIDAVLQLGCSASSVNAAALRGRL